MLGAFVEGEALDAAERELRPLATGDDGAEFSKDRLFLVRMVGDLHAPARLGNEGVERQDAQHGVERPRRVDVEAE